jgi:tyrosyl-tRNA synthetase
LSSHPIGKKDPKSLSADVLEALSHEVPSAQLMEGEVQSVLDLFVRTHLVKSKGEARRLADQGGAYVNGDRVGSDTSIKALERLAGGYLVLRKGARDYAVVELA